MSKEPTEFVSVIIPTYNDSDGLKTCLEALENQTYPKDSYEVIVVDNASDEDIKSVVSQFQQAVFAHESRRGSYAARNKGISVAKGDILAFTDSDCTPVSNWIEKGVDSLLSVPNCGMVGGRVELFFENPKEPTIFELCDSVLFLDQKLYIEKARFGVTANIFTFKDIFQKVGLFNQELKSGGDFEWGRRVFALGYQQVYADDAYVLHPARNSFKEIYKKIVRTTEGQNHLLQNKSNSFIALLKKIAWDLLPPFRLIAQIKSDDKFAGFNRKIKFFCVLMSIQYVRAWTRVKTQIS